VGNQSCARHIRSCYDAVGDLLRIHRLPVKFKLGVELTGPPTIEHLSHSALADSEQICNSAKIRSRRLYLPNVQIAIGKTVQPMTYPEGQRVIDGRMTQRALDSNGLQAAVCVEKPGYANDGVFFY